MDLALILVWTCHLQQGHVLFVCCRLSTFLTIAPYRFFPHTVMTITFIPMFSASVVCLLAVWFVSVIADEGFYVNSIAALVADAEVNLLGPPKVHNEIITSNLYDADTAGMVYITYLGKFSNSGPHLIGSFTRGSTKYLDVQLSRKIGELHTIILETTSTDNWLVSTIYCQMGQIRYEFTAPLMWLDALSPQEERAFGNGFSPNAQVNLPSTSRMEIPVSSQVYVYSPTGLVDNS